MQDEFVLYKKLPISIQVKIPLSLRCNSGKDGKIYLTDLPLYLVSLLDDYKEITEIESDKTNDVYDLIPDLSLNNDLKTINDKKQVIVFYLKNYIYCNKGSYPFVPEEGNIIKEQLFGKDDYVSELLLTEELDKVCEVISAFYDVPVKILEKEIQKQSNNEINFDYILKLTVKVKDEIFDV